MKEIKCNKRRFSVSIDKRTRTRCVQSINPYDMTEYHWARQVPNSYTWDFFHDGYVVVNLEPKHDLRGADLLMRIAEELCELDDAAGLKPCIDRT